MTIPPMPDDATADAIKRWAVEGSDLSRSMKIDFFIVTPDELTGKKIAELPILDKFKSSVEYSEDVREWTCYLTIEIIPTYAEITAIENILEAVAVSHSAEYAGFGSFGNS
jgi:hypothetical protein